MSERQRQKLSMMGWENIHSKSFPRSLSFLLPCAPDDSAKVTVHQAYEPQGLDNFLLHHVTSGPGDERAKSSREDMKSEFGPMMMLWKGILGEEKS